MEEYAKTQPNNKDKPRCALNGPGEDTNSCKVMQFQTKFMKAPWFSALRRGGWSKFTSTKNHLADIEDLNTIITSDMVKALKFKNKSKDKATGESKSDTRSESFNS